MKRRMKSKLPDYPLWCSWCNGRISENELKKEEAFLIRDQELMMHMSCSQTVLRDLISLAAQMHDEWQSDGHLLRCPVNAKDRPNECQCEIEE